MILNRFRWVGGLMMCAVLAVTGCTKATIIGNDLLDDQIKVVGFTDTFQLLTTVVPEDSIITHSGATGPQIVRHIIGKLDDPYFGKTESVIVTEMFLNGIGSRFLDYDVDSVVMTLALDTAVRYGSRQEQVSLTVTKNLTPLDVTETYYSNAVFEKDLSPMGTELYRFSDTQRTRGYGYVGATYQDSHESGFCR